VDIKNEKTTVIFHCAFCVPYVVHMGGGEGEPTRIAWQSALLVDPNALHFGTRLRIIC